MTSLISASVVDTIMKLFPRCTSSVGPSGFNLGSPPDPWILVDIDCATDRRELQITGSRCDYLLFVEPNGSPGWFVAIEEKGGRRRDSATKITSQLQGCANALRTISEQAGRLLQPKEHQTFMNLLHMLNVRAVSVTRSARTTGGRGRHRGPVGSVTFPIVYKNSVQDYVRVRPNHDLWSSVTK